MGERRGAIERVEMEQVDAGGGGHGNERIREQEPLGDRR
jgi:hypothetical protein